MRVIAGYLKGRVFDSPNNSRTHPMSERARGGLFNSLGDIDGLNFLDAFSGSGALAFEAISRGAKNVVAIEVDKKASDAIKKNIDSLELKDKVQLISTSAQSWSDNNSNYKFDVVIAAPPYDDKQLPVVIKLINHLANGGLFILDWPTSEKAPDLPGLNKITGKTYSNAQLVFYR